MKKQLLGAASLVFLGLLAGCGSSTEVKSGSSGLTISGKVADGYLEGATVFLDKNNNYRLDPGEPSTTTGKGGAYALEVDSADVGRYHILALATAGVTIDSDNPDAPITNSYLLSLHRLNVSGNVSSNFISPISSQLREMMETGIYPTIHDAMEVLRVKLGMPSGTNIMADYIAGGNQEMHETAQNMATAMGAQMPHIYRGGDSSTDTDVNRYRTMMGMIFNNMSTVRGTNSQSLGAQIGRIGANISIIIPGQPFRNMSTMYRPGGMGSGMTGGGMGGGMHDGGDAGHMPR